MRMVKVKRLDTSGRVGMTYATPRVDAVLDMDAVEFAAPTSERGCGPFLRVRLRSGEERTVVGLTVDEFLRLANDSKT